MPEIVCVCVDFASARIGLDQYLAAFAGFPEESTITPTVLRDTDMTTCHSWLDPIAVLPIGGDVAFPVGGLKFNRSFSSRHSLFCGRWFMLGIGSIEEH